MRFKHLSIQKYGAYSAMELDLGSGPGLVIAYGPNEAGKSTWLDAIGDFLFGIPTQTDRGSVYGYPGMLIHGAMDSANGTQHLLTRRKGNRETVINRDGGAGGEKALASLLGTLTRDRFRTLFGLDHESLREGGEQLLSANGEVGRIILEAGGGLRSLVRAMEALKVEASTLYGRGNQTTIRRGADELKEVERKLREIGLNRKDHEKHEKSCAQAKVALAALRDERTGIRERLSRQQRLVRVHPSLVELAAIEVELARLADLAKLSTHFAQECTAARSAHHAAVQSLADAQSSHDLLESQLAELCCDDALLGREQAVRDTSELAGLVSRDRVRRRDYEHTLVQRRAELSGLRAVTGLAPDADLAAFMPSAQDLARVDRLSVKGRELAVARDTLAERSRELRREVDDLSRQADALRGAGLTAPIQTDVGALGGLPKSMAALDAAVLRHEQTGRELHARAACLGFADIAAVRAFQCPDEQAIQSEIDRRASLRAKIEQHQAGVDAQTARRRLALAQIDRLAAGGNVPTESAIEHARRERESAWTPIRNEYLGHLPPGHEPPGERERAQAVETLVHRVADADTLADRRSVEAQRIADLGLALKERDEASVLVEVEQSGLERRTVELDEVERAWKARFPDAAAHTVDLLRLQRLVADRRELLDVARRLDADLSEAARQRAELQPSLDLLGEAETLISCSATAGDTLTARVQRTLRTIAANNARHAELERLTTAVSAKGTRAGDAESKRESCVAELDTWRSDWGTAMQAIRLASDAPLEQATNVAREWTAARGVNEVIVETERTLRSMEGEETKLRELVATFANVTREILPEDGVAASKMLVERLDAGRQEASKRRTLEAQRPARTANLARRKADVGETSQAVRLLCQAAGCSEEDLMTVAERHNEYRARLDRGRQLQEMLRGAGDGVPVEQLREEWAGHDIDALRAAVGRLEDEDRALGVRNEEAAAELRQQESLLAAREAQEGVVQLVAERERLVAELHMNIERLLEVDLAHAMLEDAVERVRVEQQAPLIKRASRLFTLATKGAFTGLSTSVDDRGQPVVVAMRAPDCPVGVTQMSEGTRDQLFLAFRIACIEDYCAKAEPLPFVADDVLVHFDDERGAATLELLAELGRVTQVVLFTHHLAVVEAARSLVQQGKARVIEVSANARLAAAGE